MPPANGHPPSTSGKVTVGKEERELFKQLREKLGYTQRDLAKKVKATSGTISNLENGKHTQIKRETYVRLRMTLLREKTVDESAAERHIMSIVSKFDTLDEEDLRHIDGVIDLLVNKKRK